MNDAKNSLTKNTWKYVEDKIVGFATFDETSKAIVKALNHDITPPKEKHVRTLLKATVKSSTQELSSMLDQLAKRTQKSNEWMVALKGLQVFHRLIQEGNEKFTLLLSQRNPARFLDMSDYTDKNVSTVIFAQTDFIKLYSKYLRQRVQLFKETGIRVLTPDYALPPIQSNAELFKLITNLQNLIEEFLQLKLSPELHSNLTTRGALNLLLRDSLFLYKIISSAILLLIDKYFKLNHKDTEVAFKIYQQHASQTDSLIKLYTEMKKIAGIDSRLIPTLKPVPKTLLTTMQQYLTKSESFDENDIPDEIPTSQVSEVLTTKEEEEGEEEDDDDSEQDEEQKRLKQYKPSKNVLDTPIENRTKTIFDTPEPKQQPKESSMLSFDDILDTTKQSPVLKGHSEQKKQIISSVLDAFEQPVFPQQQQSYVNPYQQQYGGQGYYQQGFYHQGYPQQYGGYPQQQYKPPAFRPPVTKPQSYGNVQPVEKTQSTQKQPTQKKNENNDPFAFVEELKKQGFSNTTVQQQSSNDFNDPFGNQNGSNPFE